MNNIKYFVTIVSVCIANIFSEVQENYGELIFVDDFERIESQELKDEPGNNWTTSSNKTAPGHKQVDLIDGTLHVWMHKSANHATAVRHELGFKNGSVGLKFLLPSDQDELKLNFADLSLKTVWAGHLFDVVIRTNEIVFEDKKTGNMNLKIRKSILEKSLTKEQKELLKSKIHKTPYALESNKWHELLIHVNKNKVEVEIGGTKVGEFMSEGFNHNNKALLRLLVPNQVYIDDVKFWKRK